MMRTSDQQLDSQEKDLSIGEQKLLTAVIAGSLADLRTSRTTNHPSQGKRWGTGRHVRAALLAELLTGRRIAGEDHKRAVKLCGARITGRLDLEGATLTCPLLLHACYLDEPVNLDEATTLSIKMTGCLIPGLTGRQLRTKGDLNLSGARLTASYLSLLGAHIGGCLDLRATSLANPGGYALSADNLMVDQHMFCQHGFNATGEVRMPGARLGGLNLDGAKLTNPGGMALNAQGLTVEQTMFCQEGFTALGEVSLHSANIGGHLNMSGASLVNPDGRALSAQWLTVKQSMYCADGFTAEGRVVLSGSRIGGRLSLDGAKLNNPGGIALNAERLIAEAYMTCQDKFTAIGEVHIAGAHIGTLALRSAQLTNPGGVALNADSLIVDQDMLCHGGFAADGEVRLNGARIGGRLTLTDASLVNPDGRALLADHLTVEHSLFCRTGFTSKGEIRLVSARIGGQLDLSGASLENPHGSALNLEAAQVNHLRLLPRQRPDGAVDFTNSRVSIFQDDPETWPTLLYIRGFTYDILGNEQITTRHRLEWLTRHKEGYVPQLYDQLASTYKRAGDEQAARKVAIAKQRRRRHPFSPLSWLWYITVGYGYRPWLAVAWVIALIALGTSVFSDAYPAHMMAISSHPPAFHAAAYALDLLLPVIGLGQKNAWQPRGSAYLYWSWGFTGAGWVLATAVLAGLTGILKRD